MRFAEISNDDDCKKESFILMPFFFFLFFFNLQCYFMVFPNFATLPIGAKVTCVFQTSLGWIRDMDFMPMDD